MASPPARAQAQRPAPRRRWTPLSSAQVCFLRAAPCSLGPEVHRTTNFIERLSRRIARLVSTFRNDTAYELWILLEFLGPLAQVGNFLHHLVNHGLFAFETADASRATAFARPRPGCIVRVDLVQVPDGPLLRITRVGTADAGGIRLHGAQLLHNLVRFFTHADRVAVRLRHFSTVEAGHPRRSGEQDMRLWENGDGATFQETEQAIPISDCDTAVAGHQDPG